MTKQEKIASLRTAMEVRTRTEDKQETEFTCFSDTAPKELTSLFLKSFEIRDIDYEIFSKACDILVELYEDDTLTDIKERLGDYSFDCASPYNATLLSYISAWNEEEIYNTLKEYSANSISQACAIWYDIQVEKACHIISQRIESEDEINSDDIPL